jgi:hypothetical protein
MTLKEFLLFHFGISVLKVIYIFYSRKQKEATILMIERELSKLREENEYGEFDELIGEVVKLYHWFNFINLYRS